MITKPTVRVLVAGSGLVATWLAVGSNHAVQPHAPVATQQTAATQQMSADELNAQTAKLREHITVAQLRPSTRNPFRYGAKKSSAPGLGVSLPIRPDPDVVLAAPPEPPPSYTLAGVAERNTPGGRRRTAVISGISQLYVVTEGENVGGRYTVVRIDPEAVLLRDSSGAEITLVLR